jgi:hypothetical protein
MDPTPKKPTLRLRSAGEIAKEHSPESYTAVEFWGMARSYREAANVLADERERRAPADRNKLSAPTNALYTHAIELALKAYLRAHGRLITDELWTHKVAVLYEECRGLGLVVGTNDRGQIGEVVRHLDSGNAGYGFRYFAPGSASEPAIGWTREIVDSLFRVVEVSVQNAPKHPTSPEHSGRVAFVMGKPEPKSPKRDG